jgi:hypothetical protein
VCREMRRTQSQTPSQTTTAAAICGWLRENEQDTQPDTITRQQQQCAGMRGKRIDWQNLAMADAHAALPPQKKKKGATEIKNSNDASEHNSATGVRPSTYNARVSKKAQKTRSRQKGSRCGATEKEEADRTVADPMKQLLPDRWRRRW